MSIAKFRCDAQHVGQALITVTVFQFMSERGGLGICDAKSKFLAVPPSIMYATRQSVKASRVSEAPMSRFAHGSREGLTFHERQFTTPVVYLLECLRLLSHLEINVRASKRARLSFRLPPIGSLTFDFEAPLPSRLPDF